MDKKCENCVFYNLGVCTYMPDVDIRDEEDVEDTLVLEDLPIEDIIEIATNINYA